MESTRPYSMATRTPRAEATRQRIVEAAMALFLEARYADVTLVRIAEAAGVSHQTVLNHFETKAGVVSAVVEHGRTQTIAARSTAAVGDVAGAIAALVGEYERMGDANHRWANEGLPELEPMLDEARRSHQAWLVEVLDHALPADPEERRRLVPALHAATDVSTWKLLRRDLGLDRAETETTMLALVEGVLPGAAP